MSRNPACSHHRRARRPGRRARFRRISALFLRVGCVLTLCAVTFAVLVSVADTATLAADPTVLAVDDLNQVVDRLRTWLLGILVGIATLFLTLGAVRLLAANGDPTEAEKGKTALKSAALGYALAILAPVLVTIVGSWVN